MTIATAPPDTRGAAIPSAPPRGRGMPMGTVGRILLLALATFLTLGPVIPSNIDVAPVGRGAEVLALLPVAGGRARSNLLNTLRAGARAAAQAEAQVLRARGARVRIVQPDDRARTAIGPDYFDARRQDAVMAAGVAQGRALARR
jgi:hypothetical protein